MTVNVDVLETDSTPSELHYAPKHIQLAVDLIMMFEQNNIAPDIALDALEIVKQDLLAQSTN